MRYLINRHLKYCHLDNLIKMCIIARSSILNYIIILNVNDNFTIHVCLLRVPRKKRLVSFEGKKKMVAWLVSHCNTTKKYGTRREHYVEELKKYSKSVSCTLVGMHLMPLLVKATNY